MKYYSIFILFIIIISCDNKTRVEHAKNFNQVGVQFNDSLFNEIKWLANIYNFKMANETLEFIGNPRYGILLYIFPTLFDVSVDSIYYKGKNNDTLISMLSESYSFHSGNWFKIDTVVHYSIYFDSKTMKPYGWYGKTEMYNYPNYTSFNAINIKFELDKSDIYILLQKKYLLNNWFRNEIEIRRLDTLVDLSVPLDKDYYIEKRLYLNIGSIDEN